MIVIVVVPGHFSRIHVTHLDKIDDGIVICFICLRKCTLLVPAIFFFYCYGNTDILHETFLEY